MDCQLSTALGWNFKGFPNIAMHGIFRWNKALIKPEAALAYLTGIEENLVLILLYREDAHEEIVELFFGWVGQFKLGCAKAVGDGTGTLAPTTYLVKLNLPRCNDRLLREAVDFIESLQLTTKKDQGGFNKKHQASNWQTKEFSIVTAIGSQHALLT